MVSATGLIAATYGLVRLAYGLTLPEMQASLGFDAATAGLISAGASLLYCIGAATGFVFADRAPRMLVVAAGVAAAAGAGGMAVATDAAAFAPFAVLSSAGAGLASPALVSVVRRNLPSPRVGAAQTIVNAGTGPGLVVAGAVALLLLPDWRTGWWIAAGVSAVATALVVLLDGGPATDRVAGPVRAPGWSWFVAQRRLIGAALLMGAGSAAVWNYGRSLLTAAGVSPQLAVLAWIALGLGGATVIATSRSMARRPARRAWLISVVAMVVASSMLVVSSSVFVGAFAACAVFGWGYTAATGALIAWTSEIDPQRASAGTALLFVLLVLGQALGAAAAGAVIGGIGYGWAFAAAAVVTAAAAGCGMGGASLIRSGG